MTETWYAPRDINFSTEQIIFLIQNIRMLRAGDYPTEPAEAVHSSKVGHHAPFETAAQLAAEIDWRLARCNSPRRNDGHLLEAQVLACCPLHPDALLALWYISGWKRKTMPYLDWARQNRFRFRNVGYAYRLTTFS